MNQIRKKIFRQIFKENLWNGIDSVSGSGSDFVQTFEIIKIIPKLIDILRIKVIVDLGCGDFNWFKNIDLKSGSYIGIDIVEELIQNNNLKFASDKVNFFSADIINEPIPDADLIICRDCFVHYSFLEINQALKNIIRNNSKYLLTTTFTAQAENFDIKTGNWRPINLQIKPFNMPKPIMFFNEKNSEHNGQTNDKVLALWSIEDLKDLL